MLLRSFTMYIQDVKLVLQNKCTYISSNYSIFETMETLKLSGTQFGFNVKDNSKLQKIELPNVPTYSRTFALIIATPYGLDIHLHSHTMRYLLSHISRNSYVMCKCGLGNMQWTFVSPLIRVPTVRVRNFR